MGKRGAGHPKQLASGKWVVIESVTTERNGKAVRKRPRREFATEAQALAYQARITPTTTAMPESPDARQWVLGWSAERLRRLRFEGRASYATIVERHVTMHLAPRLRGRLDALTPSAIERMLFDIQLAPQAAGRTKPLSDTYMTDIRSTLNQALEAAVRDGVLARNPVSLMERHTKSVEAKLKDREPAKAFTKPELAVLTRGLREGVADGNQFAAPLLIITATGARRGECMGWRVGDWDASTRTLTIDRQVQEVKGGGIEVCTLKTVASYRTVDVGNLTAALIMSMCKGRLPGAWLFPHPDDASRPVHADSMANWLTKLELRLGLPTLNVHALRHTHGSHLIAAGYSIADVSKRLGHASVAITVSTYLHPVEGAGLGDAWDDDVMGAEA